MCCRKLSCLLLVVAQKSSRLMTSDSFCCSPASFTIVTLLFLPKGGLASTTSYSPCFAARASFVTIGSSVSASSPMPCKSRFMAHRRVTLSTSSMPKSVPLLSFRFCALSSPLVAAMELCAASKNPPVPQAGSQIVSPGRGAITPTMAAISARGVKYCPAPPFTSSAFFCKSPS